MKPEMTEKYMPPYQGKRFAGKAKNVYDSLKGVGYCSGREDDSNIELIRIAINEAAQLAKSCKNKRTG